MITKFKTIKNLAVFQDYDWDRVLRDSGGNISTFKDINVIYGRNYSGKTTLSRIIRALEKNEISNKYENPRFEVCFRDSVIATEVNLLGHRKKIRVFNEDFIKDNLRFIVDPEASINPFAILGGNTTIEAEIKELKAVLGSNNEESKSGFYLELENATHLAKSSTDIYNAESRKLEQQIINKAINNPNGIKYKAEKFGDQNYDKSKLKKEISLVVKPSYKPLSDVEVTQKLALLKEQVKSDIQSLPKPSIDLKAINTEAEALVTKAISSSDKIEQLVKDSVLNRWVKEGKQLHNEKRQTCTFCGNAITEERWKELDSHFDEESEKLEKAISALIMKIITIIERLDTSFPIDKTLFYTKFHKKIDQLQSVTKTVINVIKNELGRVIQQLESRKIDLLNPKIYVAAIDNSGKLEWCWKIFENFRNSANSYSSLLGKEQAEAKINLRLREVSDFANTIQYLAELDKITNLKIKSELEIQNKEAIEEKIRNQIKLVEDKERLMNDEEKGALRVNEYLNNFFGHDFLSLKALEETDQVDGKKIRFEILRDGKKAYHLSEGECSLIAFCYFMAKLEDIETKGNMPIIWIDDPISSLDCNHIFFVYSLISSEIVAKKKFEQLFVSTHNLDFLKYLKRIKLEKNKYEYFIVSREGAKSFIRLMPNYLKDYTTEFNYLFEQIYQCAKATDLSDTNNHIFYNFGNNARKFLEALLFYKYPSRIDNQTSNANSKRLLKYFGNDHQATVLTERLNNELSHLEEIFDRGMIPIDIPEIRKVAQFILDKMECNDKDQFQALLESIGVEITE